MRLKWVTNPSTGRQDPMLTMSVLVVLVACTKFLLAGVAFMVNTSAVNFGNVDPTTYAALMAPVLAYHGYVRGKGSEVKKEEDKNE